MIVIDTSALAAIVFNEPECDDFLKVMRSAGQVLISTATVLEARMVTYGRYGHRGTVLFDDLLATGIFETVAPDDRTVTAAFNAFVAYGKGSGHPAGLNFGDVFSYALAKTRDLPLLFKGEVFSKTDIRPAIAMNWKSSPPLPTS
jgi:ribonuclease VapC